MNAETASRWQWRWAWFCPKCGVRNVAAAAACEGCGFGHDRLDGVGAAIVHDCGVAGPAWGDYCIGCGQRLDEADVEPRELVPVLVDDVEPAPLHRRPHRILPANDGPTEGLSLTRHQLLARSTTPVTRGERFRFMGIVAIVLLTLGLFARALAAPGDEVITFVRDHRVPGRGGDLAFSAVEQLHRVLAGAPALTPTAGPNR